MVGPRLIPLLLCCVVVVGKLQNVMTHDHHTPKTQEKPILHVIEDLILMWVYVGEDFSLFMDMDMDGTPSHETRHGMRDTKHMSHHRSTNHNRVIEVGSHR